MEISSFCGERIIRIWNTEGPVTGKDGTVYRGREIASARIKLPDFQQELPEEIQRFTVKSRFFDETNPQKSFEARGGHGGAHPHMVHEFVFSIIKDRKPLIDEIKAADWTAAGTITPLVKTEGCSVKSPRLLRKSIWNMKMAGIIEITVSGPEGANVIIRPGEHAG